MKAANCREINVKWGDENEAQRLLVRNSREARLEESAQDLWEPYEYSNRFGDHLTNGLGHKSATIDGVYGILIPCKKVWTLKKARVLTAEVEVAHDTSL